MHDGNPSRNKGKLDDLHERLTGRTDANGVTVTNTYDALGWSLSRTCPDDGVEHFGYSAYIAGPTTYTNLMITDGSILDER